MLRGRLNTGLQKVVAGVTVTWTAVQALIPPYKASIAREPH